MSLEKEVEANTVAATDAEQQERDFREVYGALHNAVQADADGVVDLGDTDDGNYTLFASLLCVDGQPPSVVIEEVEILKCTCCGDVIDLGDVTRAICVDDDGYAFRIDLDEEEDWGLTDDEVSLVYEAGRRAAILSEDFPGGDITAAQTLVKELVQPA